MPPRALDEGGVTYVVGDGMELAEQEVEGVGGGVRYGEGAERRRQSVCITGKRGKTPRSCLYKT